MMKEKCARKRKASKLGAVVLGRDVKHIINSVSQHHFQNGAAMHRHPPEEAPLQPMSTEIYSAWAKLSSPSF